MARLDSLNLEGPRAFLSPNVMPPLGPKLGVDNICGDEIECFKLLRCSIVGIPGDANGSMAGGRLLAAPVFKLSRLGFRLPFSVGGFINDGEEGSEVWKLSILEFKFRARLLGFFGLRGDGEVIGRSSFRGKQALLLSIFKLWKGSKRNVDPENEDSGTKVIGDSGEELGEGSDKEEESTVEIVVVGEESVESEACVDVLSRYWCECICGFSFSVFCCEDCWRGCWIVCDAPDNLGDGPNTGLSKTAESMSYTDINDGMWLS
jgi:hypothetical protein